jgi:hypothetical protein
MSPRCRVGISIVTVPGARKGNRKPVEASYSTRNAAEQHDREVQYFKRH